MSGESELDFDGRETCLHVRSNNYPDVIRCLAPGSDGITELQVTAGHHGHHQLRGMLRRHSNIPHIRLISFPIRLRYADLSRHPRLNASSAGEAILYDAVHQLSGMDALTSLSPRSKS